MHERQMRRPDFLVQILQTLFIEQETSHLLTVVSACAGSLPTH